MGTTVIDPTFTRILSNCHTQAVLVEFRDHAEFMKGPTQGQGFEWIPAEGTNASEIFDNALKTAIECAESGSEIVRLKAASMLVIKVSAQWDKDGKMINERKWNLEGTRMISDKDM